MAGNVMYILMYILVATVVYNIYIRDIASRNPNRYSPSLTTYKCFIDNDYGIYDTKAECEVALAYSKPKASIDQSCATKKCIPGAFCNDKLVCENTKGAYMPCQPGECGENLYCAPGSDATGKAQNVCMPSYLAVPSGGKCSDLFLCDAGLTCVSGRCAKKASLQVSVTMTPSVYNVTVNSTDITGTSGTGSAGMHVYSFAGEKLVGTSHYVLPTDTAQFIRDSRDYVKMGVTVLVICIYNTNASNIPMTIRSTLGSIGAEALRYADANYIGILDFRKRIRLYEDVSPSVLYNKTLLVD